MKNMQNIFIMKFFSNLIGIAMIGKILLFFISLAIIIIVISYIRRKRKTRPYTFMSLHIDLASNIDTHIDHIANVLFLITEYNKLREEIKPIGKANKLKNDVPEEQYIMSMEYIQAIEFFDSLYLNKITKQMETFEQDAKMKKIPLMDYIKKILRSNFRQNSNTKKYYHKECEDIYSNLANLIKNVQKIRESTNLYNYLDLETIVKEKSIYDNQLWIKYHKYFDLKKLESESDSSYDFSWIPEANIKTYENLKTQIPKKTSNSDSDSDSSTKLMLLKIYNDLNNIYNNANYDYSLKCQSKKSEKSINYKKALENLETKITNLSEISLEDIDDINENEIEILLQGKNSFNEHLIHNKQKFRDDITFIKMSVSLKKNSDTIHDAFYLTLKLHLEEKTRRKKLIAWLKKNIQLNQELLYIDYELSTNLKNIHDYDRRRYVCKSEVDKFWKKYIYGYLYPFYIYENEFIHLWNCRPPPNKNIYSIVNTLVDAIPSNNDIIKEIQAESPA